MKRIGNILAGALLWLIAVLPFWALYLLSDILYVLIYRVAGYRRKVVRRNIADSFPEMTEREVKAVERRFYRNFSDYILETIKLSNVSFETISRRMTFENTELLKRHLSAGQPIVAYFSHCGNWEWVTILSRVIDPEVPHSQSGEVYRPLKNKWFDAKMLSLRQRFGSKCYPKATVLRKLLREKLSGVVTLTAFMSDQKPSHGDRVHIIEFLNHPTAVITGTETVGKKLRAAGVYIDIRKTGRGRYAVNFVEMTDNFADTADFEMTDLYFKLLEATIRRQPDIWLWSHNRWKYPVTLH